MTRMWFKDLARCTEMFDSKKVLAVGWLEYGKRYRKGDVDQRVYDKLIELNVMPWAPMYAGGFHTCDLCDSESKFRGKVNLYIPGKKVIYVCPELITHYIDTHDYSPPIKFCHAVLECPPMNSKEYFIALRERGMPVMR